jgi:hypothetical protein
VIRPGAQPPASLIPESLRDDLHMERIYGHGAPCHRGEHEITIGAVDDDLAGEAVRYGGLEGLVTLISASPLLS